MKPLKAKVSISMDEEDLAKIKILAEYDGRNLSQYINIVLKRHIARLEQKDGAET
ncbi:MAG: toxin-antitoxin system protein [Ruminococcaceae bacterium]|nr:toxin-antitoxin system protein [Oscillospiraceae bacterium]